MKIALGTNRRRRGLFSAPFTRTRHSPVRSVAQVPQKFSLPRIGTCDAGRGCQHSSQSEEGSVMGGLVCDMGVLVLVGSRKQS